MRQLQVVLIKLYLGSWAVIDIRHLAYVLFVA